MCSLANNKIIISTGIQTAIKHCHTFKLTLKRETYSARSTPMLACRGIHTECSSRYYLSDNDHMYNMFCKAHWYL